MAGQPAGGWAPPAQAPLAFVPSSFEAAPEAQHAPQPHQHRGPPGGGYAADPSFSRPSFAAPSFAQSLSQPHYAPPPYGAPPPARFSALPASGSSGELYRHPVGGAVGHATFDDEPPLLEELGIDLRHILRKTRSMLTPFAADAALCDDADLAGPLVFAAALGVCHLLMGKVTFGYIIGWSVLSMVSVHGLVNALSQGGGGGGVELYRCGSLLGYCLLPVVLFAGCAALALPQGCAAAWALAAAAVGWASATASGLLVAIVPGLEGQRALVAWPCGLAYSLFALLTLG